MQDEVDLQRNQAVVATEAPEISGLSENKLASMLLKRRQQEYKDRDYDSDDDLRKEMLTYDDRLTFVNKVDYKLFHTEAVEKAKTADSEGKVDEDAEQQRLPIILHEREIMENIENFLVTIVCGETGSGKST